jgi:uncharacterized RDD family membrane protein YckC
MTDSTPASSIEKSPRYPELNRRYLCSFIDGMIVFTTAMAVGLALQGERLVVFRVGSILLIILAYEPVLTSKLCTVGQFAMNLRVRRYESEAEYISLSAAYLRYVVKVMFGFYSFFAMSFNRERRALHDLVAGSIVVENGAITR